MEDNRAALRLRLTPGILTDLGIFGLLAFHTTTIRVFTIRGSRFDVGYEFGRRYMSCVFCRLHIARLCCRNVGKYDNLRAGGGNIKVGV